MLIDTSLTDSGLDMLVASSEWRRLTCQQKLFVADFITGGDAQHAITVAYPKANSHSQRIMKHQVLHAPAVVEALEFWKWRDARAALIAIAKQNLKSAEPGSTAAGKFAIQLERLLLHVPGSNGAHFVDPDEDPNESEELLATAGAVKTFVVGMIVNERGPDGVLHTGKVTAVAADGSPTIEEIL